jgi:hypothetical protein
MTAEAMAMRYLLGLPVSSQASAEARGMMMAQLPGQREVNFYYWYYAALALFQMRATELNSLPGMRSSSDVAWEHWNNAMKQQLCSTQRVDGSMAGSWDPNCVWGAYGGRVYTTALGCMCLEVYYRYMPIYQTLEIASPVASRE